MSDLKRFTPDSEERFFCEDTYEVAVMKESAEGDYVEYEQSAKLIEQQHKRIVELERERADVAKKAFTKGASFGHFNWRKIPFDSTLVPEAAEQYANQLREQDDE